MSIQELLRTGTAGILLQWLVFCLFVLVSSRKCTRGDSCHPPKPYTPHVACGSAALTPLENLLKMQTRATPQTRWVRILTLTGSPGIHVHVKVYKVCIKLSRAMYLSPYQTARDIQPLSTRLYFAGITVILLFSVVILLFIHLFPSFIEI